MARSLLLVTFTLILSACVTGRLPPCPPPATDTAIYVVAEGWHTDLSIPVAELGPRLAFYRTMFPGARYLMFGYGKRTFFMAPSHTWKDYMLSVVPGPAAIEVTGLNVSPIDAYGPGHTRKLVLTPDEVRRLNAFIGTDLAKGPDGAVLPPVARNDNPVGLFYAARSEYSIAHTCNTWTEDALRAANMPMVGDVMTSDEVMARVDPIAARQCFQN